jgi:DNA-binding SARP family transcriptional activator/tetratricopeptide (TPR) repeat protein
VEFQLLGPVQVCSSGRILDAGPPRQRTVLAALLVDVGRVVAGDVLVDRVWGEDAPRDARGTLSAHLSRIRRLLDEATQDGDRAALVYRSGGYVLDVDPARVDVVCWRQLVAAARVPGYPVGRRLDLLREAVALWHGEALAGLAGLWATFTRQAWREEQVDVMVAWADEELRAGDPATVVGPLTELAGERPLAESVTAVLMRALAATGRPAEALRLFAEARERLAEELGTSPGPALSGVHQWILRNDVATVRALRSGARPGRSVPQQLPAPVPYFTGRTAALTQLTSLLQARPEQAATTVICAIVGTAGVGKTALAVHWAHQVADRFPDGQLYVNLRGFDPTGALLDPADVIRQFLDVLDVPARRIPSDLEALAAGYRSALAGRQILILLDNARDAAHVRPLLPGAPGCLVLITSRSQLTGLVAADGAHPVNLDLLEPAEARHMLAHRLGPERTNAEPDAVDDIVDYCARLPLALAIAAARAATHPHLPLGELAAELRDAANRLDTLTTTHDDPATDLRTVFSWSYHALAPATRRLFWLLGAHPGPDISTAAAASLAGTTRRVVRTLLVQLTRANLLAEHTSGRYTCHDLLRVYATELAHTTDPDPDRHAATHRFLDHYLHTAYTASLLLSPARDRITLAPPQPGVVAEQPGDQMRALDWFTAEHAVLTAAVNHAATTGFDTHAWQLAWTLADFSARRGFWRAGIQTYRVALAAAYRLSDPLIQAHMHRDLATAYGHLDRFEAAHTQLRHALRWYDRSGDLVGQAHTRRALTYLLERQGRYSDALDHARQALDLYQAAGHRRGKGLALNLVGWYLARLGEYEQAITPCRQALALLRTLDDNKGQANSWDSLGYANHHLGRHTQAITCYLHALDLFRELGDRYNEADTLTNLGDTHHAAGDSESAHDAWQRALAVLIDLDHPDAERVRTKLATTSTYQAGASTARAGRPHRGRPADSPQ